jgi:ribosomal protein L29
MADLYLQNVLNFEDLEYGSIRQINNVRQIISRAKTVIEKGNDEDI